MRLLLIAALILIAGKSLWLLANYVRDFLEPGAYVWDSTLYWAMGRGILNGLTPYIDLFDNKPPGIYLISAFSLWLFGNGMLGNFIGAASLISLPLLSILIVWRERRSGNLSPLATRILVTLALALSMSWISFQALFGRPWQTEQFAALFGVCYAFFIVTMGKPRARRTILLGICLLGSIGLKEPFIFSCFAAALLVDPRLRTLKQTFFKPLLVAVILGITIMALTGMLLPYLFTDLPTVLGFRITGFTSPFLIRIFSVHRPLAQLAQITPLLTVLAIILPIVYARLIWTPKHQVTEYIRPVAFAVIIILILTFSIGIGGDFQDHHYAVPAPFIATIVFLTLIAISRKWHQSSVRLLTAGLLTVSGVTILLIPLHDVSVGSTAWSEEEQTLRVAAAGVDTVLRRCNIDRYLYIHPDGALRLDGFTEHSSMNHALFFPIDQAYQNGPGFQNIAIKRISESQVMVLPQQGYTATNEIGKMIVPYIIDKFSADPPPCARPLPEIPGFFLIFRTSDEPLDFLVDVSYEM